MVVAVSFLIGAMGGSLALLAGLHVAATKYLGGSCLNSKTNEPPNNDHGEDGGETGGEEIPCKTPEPFTEYSKDGARKRIQSSGFGGGEFASKAVLVFNLKYFADNKRIVGSIKCVQNWDKDADDAPKQIKFVTKTLKTKKKLSATTASVSTKRDILALMFTIGPIQEDEITNSSLCIKMLGSPKKLKKNWKCYGECYVDLIGISGKLVTGVDLRKDIMPQAVYLTEGGKSKTSKKNKPVSSNEAEDLGDVSKEQPIKEKQAAEENS